MIETDVAFGATPAAWTAPSLAAAAILEVFQRDFAGLGLLVRCEW
jgi:hypothetical protein